MTARVFLTDRLFQKYGNWLGQGLADALFNVWHRGDVFEIQPDVILLDQGQGIQFIRQLDVPKIFISTEWEAEADDVVPADLDWIIASIRAQLQIYQKRAVLLPYRASAEYNGLLEPTALTDEPADLLVFAPEMDRAILDIQLQDYHKVYDPNGFEGNVEGIVVKDDLQKLVALAASDETKNKAMFFWSADKAKLLAALQAGFDGVIPHMSQAEPRITKKITDTRMQTFLAQQLEGALELAARDSLTGLYNHRCFNKHLPLLLQNINANATYQLAAISLDLDNFKNINDHWGHSTGDGILQNVASLLQEELRAGDSLYRTGGDEFLALVQNVSTIEDCYALAERLCRMISETYFVIGEEVVPLTISAGISFYEKGENIESLLHRADTGLYTAKNAGRGRAA